MRLVIYNLLIYLRLQYAPYWLLYKDVLYNTFLESLDDHNFEQMVTLPTKGERAWFILLQ